MSAAPVTSDLSAHRDLGVAWMNRGHALQLDGRLADAISAYAEAVTLLRPLLVTGNSSWANSLGAALMNRGQLLHRLHGTACATEALASFDEAAAVLGPICADDTPWPRRNLAGTWLNRANLLLDLARQTEALAIAREAIALSAPAEKSELTDTDLALKARRALCDALGQLLVAPGADQAVIAAEASDLVDDALALIRFWGNRGTAEFQSLALRFFRYGTQLYRFHQPHFLAEFIAENLPATDASFHAIALDAIDSALVDKPRNHAYLTIGDPASERRLQTWRELAALRTSLTA